MAIMPTSVVAGLAFGVVMVIGSLYSSRGVNTAVKTSRRENTKGKTDTDSPLLLNFGATSMNYGQSYLPDPDMVFRDHI
jgi:hypothetical protein